MFFDRSIAIKMQELIHFDTSAGSFTLELYTRHAPKTCFNFVELVKMGYYDDHIFHRIIRDFVS